MTRATTGGPEMLRGTEAAVVSGVPLREVNRTVDERVLPAGCYSVGRDRRFSPGACVMIAFYHASADDLTRGMRARLISTVEPRLRHLAVDGQRSRGEGWSLTDGFAHVDFAPFVERAMDRIAMLRDARAMVTRSPEILDGVAVIRGTRVPVYDVGASVKAGHSRERIREAYPSLSDEQIALAALYAEAIPPKGRPKAPPSARGTAVSERRVSRRIASG